ncbi:hypothetical protein LXL04_035704 [Taraxacum kok-saghyz]
MAISDMVAGNLTILYLVVIAAIKVYGQLSGRCYGGAAMLILSTATVGVLLVGALTWDISRKVVTCSVVTRCDDEVAQELCRGGICWHGVAVKSPASQFGLKCSWAEVQLGWNWADLGLLRLYWTEERDGALCGEKADGIRALMRVLDDFEVSITPIDDR